MEVNLQFLRRFYVLLLTFYPRSYQEEYGGELQAVFNLSLEHAIKSGSGEVALAVLRELMGLPKAILYEHLRERRKAKMTGKFASRFDFVPGSWTEAFTALAPFLFGMAMVFFGYLGKYITFPLWSQVTFVIAFWSLVLGLFLLGPAKGLPRWFLPYLGLPLPIVSLLLFNSLMDKWGVVWMYKAPWFFSTFTQEGLLWMGMILLLFLLFVISRLVPLFHPFHQRLKDDWTLLSFVIYGAMPFVLFISYNEYKNEEPFMFLSLASLAAGGWLYLRSPESLKRFLYLQGGMALSMLIAAVGKALLHDSSFPTGHGLAWKTEFLGTLITWLWLALIMLIAPALNLLPRVKSPLPAAQS